MSPVKLILGFLMLALAIVGAWHLIRSVWPAFSIIPAIVLLCVFGCGWLTGSFMSSARFR